MLHKKLRIADIGQPSNLKAAYEANNVLRKVVYIKKQYNTDTLKVSQVRKRMECNQIFCGRTFWKIVTSQNEKQIGENEDGLCESKRSTELTPDQVWWWEILLLAVLELGVLPSAVQLVSNETEGRSSYTSRCRWIAIQCSEALCRQSIVCEPHDVTGQNTKLFTLLICLSILKFIERTILF